MVVIVIGLPGSGKSYFAAQLAAILHATYINSDLERKKMLQTRSYTEQEKLSVYGAMLDKMKELIRQQQDVLVDATFYRNEIRDRFFKEAAGKTALFVIEIKANEPVIRERLKKRRPDSEADFEVYQKIKAQWEPYRGDHLALDSTDDNITEMLKIAVDYLQVQNDK